MTNKLATLAAFAALFVALVGNATTLFVAEKAAEDTCLRAQANRDIMIHVLERGRESVRTNPELTDAARKRGLDFYRAALAEATPIDCR